MLVPSPPPPDSVQDDGYGPLHKEDPKNPDSVAPASRQTPPTGGASSDLAPTGGEGAPTGSSTPVWLRWLLGQCKIRTPSFQPRLTEIQRRVTPKPGLTFQTLQLGLLHCFFQHAVALHKRPFALFPHACGTTFASPLGLPRVAAGSPPPPPPPPRPPPPPPPPLQSG